MDKKTSKATGNVAERNATVVQPTQITVELSNEMRMKMQAIVAMSEAQREMAKALGSCSAIVNICNNAITVPDSGTGINVNTKPFA